MSTKRRKQGGWAGKRPRGPNGRPTCRQCGAECPVGRRTFCSSGCVAEWRLRTDPGYLRSRVHSRDKGVCAACGFDADKLERIITAATCHYRDDQQRAGHREYWQVHGGPRSVVMGALGLRHHGHTWEADHVVPVIEGGGECGLDNMRTLCLWCHRSETKALRRRLAQRAKPLPMFQEGP